MFQMFPDDMRCRYGRLLQAPLSWRRQQSYRNGYWTMSAAISPIVGISAIATYEPPWVLCNDWFQSILPRKFVEHSGIVSRRISQEDEVTMGVRAVENLRRETHHIRLADCAAVVFVASSLVSPAVVEQSPDRKQVAAQVRPDGGKAVLPADRLPRGPGLQHQLGLQRVFAGDGDRAALDPSRDTAADRSVHPGGHGELHEQDC